MTKAEEAKTFLIRKEHIKYYIYSQQKEYLFYTYNGAFVGEYISWYKNGQIANYINYAHGCLHGKFKQWDEYGKLVFHSIYNNGTEIKDYLDVE